ncbi:MAG: 1-deoxy-D-xylulose-5-phosphate reductoisomerase [Actinomycetes bacterium]
MSSLETAGHRRVVVLGSTGSVGTQALEVAAASEGRLRVVALAAGGRDPQLVADQVAATRPEVVAVADPAAAEPVRAAIAARGLPVPTVLAGPEAAAEVAQHPADVVLNAITGSVGLRPTLAALAAGATLALANKESLVAGGPLVKAAASPGQIVPVDSEHSAIAQCLRGGSRGEVSRLVLTASGGPFRGWTSEQLRDVTAEQALAHPTWDMGPVVTINSATLMNKGLEVLEAHLLFDIPLDRIAVTVHPQSLVHSMVEFVDGSTLAQVSPPDMRLPIALGLTWPDRLPQAARAMDWTQASTWEFLPLDEEAFPAVALCRAAGQAGGTAPAALNAANEECVAAFRAGALGFLAIPQTLETVLAENATELHSGNTPTLDDVDQAEKWARARARELTGWAGRDGGER